MAWVQHGKVWDDDGNPGGDDQIGKASSVRFVNPDFPGARVTVHAYATAPERAVEAKVGSIEVFMGYEPNLDNLGIQSSVWFEIEDDATSHDADEWEPDWSEIQYEDLDAFIAPGPDEKRVAVAEAAAHAWVRAYNPERDIHWDGKRF
jgi:hypothetical protein